MPRSLIHGWLLSGLLVASGFAAVARGAALSSRYGDADMTYTVTEPNNSTVWYPGTQAKIAWITDASNPNAMKPIDFRQPLRISLAKRTGDAFNYLPVVLADHSAYRDDGSITIVVPQLEADEGYQVYVASDGHSPDHTYPSQYFSVKRNDTHC
ncbi:hypothetical protein C8Q77DRAFT_1154428 [Trametes polyzona]|nr:hypothetical protein C8Q77DRAFT_1154428 [Trametes polyzona]